MKIAMCQMAMSHSRKENLEKSLSALYEAAAAGAELILYPEIQLSRFFPQYPGRDASDMALAIDSEEVMAFRRACRETGIIAVPNFYLEEKGGCYDTSVFIGADGEIIGKQKMVHIAQAEQFYEQDYYAPSDEGFLVFDTPHGRIGAVICFDRHYPESIRTEALMGADLILIPTANTKAEPSEMWKCLSGSCVFRHFKTRSRWPCATAWAGRTRCTSPESPWRWTRTGTLSLSAGTRKRSYMRR